MRNELPHPFGLQFMSSAHYKMLLAPYTALKEYLVAIKKVSIRTSYYQKHDDEIYIQA